MHPVPENVGTIIDLISRSTTIKLVEAYGGTHFPVPKAVHKEGQYFAALYDNHGLELGHNATVNKVLVPNYRLCDRRIEEILDKGDDWVPLSDTRQGLLF